MQLLIYEGPSIGNALYQSSLEKGGDFANNVISNIAQGNYGQVGSITGEGAEAAFQSYMGISADNKANHSYTNVENRRWKDYRSRNYPRWNQSGICHVSC